jgi:hypothetical protein
MDAQTNDVSPTTVPQKMLSLCGFLVRTVGLLWFLYDVRSSFFDGFHDGESDGWHGWSYPERRTDGYPTSHFFVISNYLSLFFLRTKERAADD